MKKLFIFSLVMFATGMAMLLSGCSDTEQFVESEAPAPLVIEEESAPDHVLTRAEFVALTVQEKGTYKITESEALQHLEEFNPAVVSDESQSPVLTTGITLRKSPQTGKDMYYEVVIESDKGTGFCLLSADERADELLCYTENGSIADTAFNKSLKYCLELVDRYVEEQISEELDVETLALSAQQKITSGAYAVKTKNLPAFDPNDPNSPWYYVGPQTTTTVSERLKFVPGGWHQESPFNNLLPLVSTNPDVRAYAGCDVIAVSQIMAYHKKPFSNYITTAMWPSMIANPGGSVDLQNLIRDIFYSIIISFDENGSTSNQARVRTFLNNNGYTAGSVTGYNYDKVWTALNYGPTCIRGGSSTDGGHDWVVDGARTTTSTTSEMYNCLYNGNIYEASAGSYTYTTQQVHYDWGWGPNSNNPNSDAYKNNAWFSNNVFQRGANSPNFNSINEIISYIY